MENSSQPSTDLRISVVVPVKDEQNSVGVLLEALLSQTLAPNEIVITDGGSSDGTIEIVESFLRNGAPIKLVREQSALPGRGRNVGVMHAAHDWIAFTDAGNKPAPDWLAQLAAKIRDRSGVDVVYGSYQPVIDSFFKECAAIAYVPSPAVIEGSLTRPRFIASTLMRRRVWQAVDGFPEHLRSAEDLLFFKKLDREKFVISRAPKAIVYWEIQPNLWRTFKRFVIYARNNMRAGLWREWQAAIVLRYGLILTTTIPAIWLGLPWLFVPILIWLGLILARSIIALRRNRYCYPAGRWRNLARLFLLVPIISVLDAAALIGNINWLIFDKIGLNRELEPEK